MEQIVPVVIVAFFVLGLAVERLLPARPLPRVRGWTARALASFVSTMAVNALVPAVLVGALTGRWVVERIPHLVFEMLVVAMTAVATLLLFR